MFCSYFSCRSGIISEEGYCCSKQLDPTLIMAKVYTLVYMLLGQAVQSKLILIGTYVYFARLKLQSLCNVQHIRKEQMLVQVIDTLLKI